MKNAKSLIMLVTLMVLSLAIVCTPAFGQQKYVLKFNHVLGPKEPYHLGFTNWAKNVEAKTKGGLKIEV
ncbi:MAG: C4-dicarboxylate ABC transporter, partial [Deltaproteobacteria bacterium]|nr:C4-dicarboxylate ABC transporter [Deltaproteobacteria bacterium]